MNGAAKASARRHADLSACAAAPPARAPAGPVAGRTLADRFAARGRVRVCFARTGGRTARAGGGRAAQTGGGGADAAQAAP